MVRLITHNLLACHAKGCNANNFPLKFQNIQLEFHESEMNVDFLKSFIPKLEWRALIDTAREVEKSHTIRMSSSEGNIIAWRHIFTFGVAQCFYHES